MRQNALLAQKWELDNETEWSRVRNIEFAIRQSSFAISFDGKSIFPFKSIKKPKDLYTLPSEDIKKKSTTAVFDPDRALEAYNKSNNKPKWLHK